MKQESREPYCDICEKQPKSVYLDSDWNPKCCECNTLITERTTLVEVDDKSYRKFREEYGELVDELEADFKRRNSNES